MEINTKLNGTSAANLAPAQRRAPTAVNTPAPQDSFTSSAALETALKNTPTVRPEAVERARALINDPGYPSADTVKKLSSFLAGKLASHVE